MKRRLVGEVGGQAALFKEQKGAAAEEGREWRLHREDGDGVPETRMEAAEHVQHLLAITHGGAEVSKTIDTILEAGEEGADGGPPCSMRRNSVERKTT